MVIRTRDCHAALFTLFVFWGSIVPALDRKKVFVTHFIRKLRGESQTVLVAASYGNKYELEFIDNPQDHNLLFNETMGSELFPAVGLPVPVWKTPIITEKSLHRSRQCGLDTAKRSLKPKPTVCFGGSDHEPNANQVSQILPESSFSRRVNGCGVSLARPLDICARHDDKSQAERAYNGLTHGKLNGTARVILDRTLKIAANASAVAMNESKLTLIQSFHPWSAAG